MLVIGLTGGIGSGKTTVAKEFNKLGVPVYIADDEAKKLMNKSKVIKRKLIQLFGEQAYLNNQLNRPYIASLIFSNKDLLNKMNAIVHPKVAKHFKRWFSKQKAPYVIKEVAILFENDGYKSVDKVITVVAPEKTRIERVIKRDNSTKEKVLTIIKNQWSDTEKMALSNYVIKNIDIEGTIKQVHEIHEKLLKIV